MHKYCRDLIPYILDGTPLDVAGAAALVPLLPNHLPDIMALARLAASTGARDSFLCGLVSAKSGNCPEDCAFCAQSARHGTNAPVHPLLHCNTLLRRAEALACNGVRYMGIVISGTGPNAAELETVCEYARSILERVDIKLCASIGILTPAQALALKQAGFTSCHHNMETAPSFYPSVCTSHAIDARIATARHISAAGLRLCSGGIFGMGESWEQRLELSALLAALNVDAIPINFLNPIPGTPLESASLLAPAEALGIVALLRLMHPQRDIVLCGGRSVVLGHWDALAFTAGANAMISGDYLTTKGAAFARDAHLLALLGMKPGLSAASG